MKKLVIAFLIVFGVAQTSVSQNSNIEKVVSFDFKNVKAIYENDQVKGYYFMYTMEKAGSGESKYGLCIYDNNFKQTNFKEVTKSKNIKLKDAKFNGDHFCFHFFDEKEKKFEYVIYSSDLTEKGKYVTAIPKEMVELMKESEGSPYAAMIGQTHTLVSLPGIGFAIYGTNSTTQKFEIIGFNNSGTELWKAGSGKTDDKAYEACSFLNSDKDRITFEMNFYKDRKKPFEGERFFGSFDLKTGKMFPKLMIPNFKNIVGVTDLVEGKPGYKVISGEFYDKSSKQTGIAVCVISNDGALASESYISLKDDAPKVVTDAEKLKMMEDRSVLIRKVFQMNDKTFVIGELYDKKNIYDMLIFEIEKGVLTKINFMDKKKTNIASYINTVNGQAAVGMMLKMGLFTADDYCYTTITADKMGFTTVYCNYEKDSDSGDYIIGAATYKDGKMLNDQVKLTTKPSQFTVLPAKPGYVAVFEYYKKDKKVIMRLEKLNT